MKTISIAMTTYNGEKFLEEQLLSFYNQERQPDEVLICDDGSSDSTVEIANRFIATHDLSSKWHVVGNKINKGLTKNFLETAEMTSGDIIFFSDQDDIWNEKKIARMVNVFEKNEVISALSCTSTHIDSNGEIADSSLNKLQKGKGGTEIVTFTKQIKNNRSAGLTLAVKRDFLNYVKPIIMRYNLPFDLPIGLLAASKGEYAILKEPLVYHRVHENNLSTPKYTLKSRLNSVKYHISGRQLRLTLMIACADLLENDLSNIEKKNLNKLISKTGKSIDFLYNRKIIPLFFYSFTLNPMENKLISLTNFLCALLGDYNSISNNRKGKL